MNLNRREFWYGLWGAAALLLLALTFAIVVWAITPRSRAVDLGPLTSFSADDPTLKLATFPNNGTRPIWVVKSGSHWLAFEGQSRPRPGCHNRWLPSSDQFWDICSGWTFIWAKTGELLSYPAWPSPALEPYVRDLDQYPVWLKGEHLFIDPDHLTRGAPRTTPPPEAACEAFDDGTLRWLRCSLAG